MKRRQAQQPAGKTPTALQILGSDPKGAEASKPSNKSTDPTHGGWSPNSAAGLTVKAPHVDVHQPK